MSHADEEGAVYKKVFASGKCAVLHIVEHVDAGKFEVGYTSANTPGSIHKTLGICKTLEEATELANKELLSR